LTGRTDPASSLHGTSVRCGLGDGPILVRQVERIPMKALCYIAAAGLLISAPAMAQQNGNGGGFTNIWSSAQGTSNSYGQANAFGTSSAGSAATAGGRGGLNGFGGGGAITSLTTSNAGTSSTGSGYAQAQTSGYAGGTASGSGSRGR
jgi:hypothetical protein